MGLPLSHLSGFLWFSWVRQSTYLYDPKVPCLLQIYEIEIPIEISFTLAKMRERKIRDLDHVKCIKSNDQNVLMKENDIKKKRIYFIKLLNEDSIGV